MQFANLKNAITGSVDSFGENKIEIASGLFRKILASALQSKEFFDENFYLTSNADIHDAVQRKQIPSGADHYFNTGYYEDRMPRKLLVDEKFYLEQNPDVATAIRKGLVKSAQEHFDYAGFKEGRAPYKGFSLF